MMAKAQDVRLSKIESILSKSELTHLLVTKPQNIFYLTGFYGTSGILLAGPGASKLFVDFRYFEEAKERTAQTNVDVVLVKDGYLDEVFKSLKKGATVGFEADHLSVSKHNQATKKLKGIELIATESLIENERMIKDDEEIRKIEKACSITDGVFERIIGQIKPKVLERSVAFMIEDLIREGGGDGPAFDVIVASGPNSARPHASAGERSIAKGDFIKLDFGTALNGYSSDMTRMVHVGKVDDEKKALYEIVRRAQEAALSGIKPAMTTKAADGIARDIIMEAGFDEEFAHGLGHGIGLEIHEKPTLSPKDEASLKEGMVFTVEPGLYFEGRFGIRIEDTVVLEEDGPRRLTLSERELIEL